MYDSHCLTICPFVKFSQHTDYCAMYVCRSMFLAECWFLDLSFVRTLDIYLYTLLCGRPEVRGGQYFHRFLHLFPRVCPVEGRVEGPVQDGMPPIIMFPVCQILWQVFNIDLCLLLSMRLKVAP
jgi:hypothetical protein